MRILVCNDDGIESPGLHALADAARPSLTIRSPSLPFGRWPVKSVGRDSVHAISRIFFDGPAMPIAS